MRQRGRGRVGFIVGGKGKRMEMMVKWRGGALLKLSERRNKPISIPIFRNYRGRETGIRDNQKGNRKMPPTSLLLLSSSSLNPTTSLKSSPDHLFSIRGPHLLYSPSTELCLRSRMNIGHWHIER